MKKHYTVFLYHNISSLTNRELLPEHVTLASQMMIENQYLYAAYSKIFLYKTLLYFQVARSRHFVNYAELTMTIKSYFEH